MAVSLETPVCSVLGFGFRWTAIGRNPRLSGETAEWLRYAPGMATPEIDGDIEYAPLWAGESCSVVNDVKPAAQIVGELVRDAAQALAASTAS